jgi:hypothetical protein
MNSKWYVFKGPPLMLWRHKGKTGYWRKAEAVEALQMATGAGRPVKQEAGWYMMVAFENLEGGRKEVTYSIVSAEYLRWSEAVADEPYKKLIFEAEKEKCPSCLGAGCKICLGRGEW